MSTPPHSIRRRAWLGWFGAGAMLALAGQIAFVLPSPDNWAGLLRVGSANPLLPQIESELGPLHPTDALGHDGQISYLIARDPFNRNDTAGTMRELDQAPYRYRRILYSLLAGGFGTLPGGMTLMGLVIWAIVGVGLATAAAADLGHQLQLARWAVLASMANLGALLSAVLLTSDALALGLALGGVALVRRGRLGGAMSFLAFAALTKEVYLLFAWSVAVWLWLERRRGAALLTAVTSVIPVGTWALWVAISQGGYAPGLHHLTFPLSGIIEAVPLWLASEPAGSTLMVGMLVTCMVIGSLGLAILKGDRLLTLCGVAWAALGLILSVSVWSVPTNALRALAPLWVLGLLNLSASLEAHRPELVAGREAG